MAVRVGAAAHATARLIPDLTPYPPAQYLVVYHPDVQLTPEEWLELKDYEKIESDALCDPGVLGFMMKPRAKVVVPLTTSGVDALKPVMQVAAAKLHEGR